MGFLNSGWFFSGVGNLVRVLTGLVVIRLLTQFFGVESLLFYSEYVNYSSILTSFSGGMFALGVTVKVASEKTFNPNIIKLSRSSILIPYATTLFGFAAFIICIPSPLIPLGVLLFLSLFIFINVSYRHWCAIMQGLQDFKRICFAGIILFLALITSVVLARFAGEMLFYFLMPFCALPSVFYLSKGYRSSDTRGIVRSYLFKHGLFKFGVYSASSAFFSSILGLYMRRNALQEGSLYLPHEWQAVYSVSNNFITVLAVPVAAVLLPLFCNSSSSRSTKTNGAIFLTLCFSLVGCFMIFIFRDFISYVLFANKIVFPVQLLLIYLSAGVTRVLQLLFTQSLLASGRVYVPLGGELFLVIAIIIACESRLIDMHFSYLLFNLLVLIGLFLTSVTTSTKSVV